MLTLEEKRAKHALAQRRYMQSHPEARAKATLIQRRYVQRHPEVHERVSQWKLSHREAVLEDLRLYKKNHPEKFLEYQRRSRERNPEKHTARWKAERHTSLAVKCANCGSSENLERHHPNYEKPLEIVTLCQSCHRASHSERND